MNGTTWAGPLVKPSATKRKLKTIERKKRVDAGEDANKRRVRARDRSCRMPKCGCRKFGLALKARPEVSHDRHKGMGGNPRGDRSDTSGMALYCKHRHQDGAISFHKGTLRARFLSRHGYNGPVAFDVDSFVAIGLAKGRERPKAPAWLEVARESAPGVLEPLEGWQSDLLDKLARMEM